MHAIRTLALYQKVILLNTFITAKVWYLSSILPPYCVHTAKITATMGNFMWRRQPARVPMQQMARLPYQGGLKLQLPAFKTKALLINRHLQEIGSIPFYNSFLSRANPNPPPTDIPCLKTIMQTWPRLPQEIQQNPSSDQIYRLFIEQTDQPRVELHYPAVNWRRVWLNIGNRQLSSTQRSSWYLLVNGKVEHRQLWHTIRRVDNDQCLHCVGATETLKHKLSQCPRVTAAWVHLQNKLANITGGRTFCFEDLIFPVLNRLGRRQNIVILKNFVNYVTFILNCDNVVDVGELDFHLQVEL
jgi:hypothetical protein